MNRAQLIPTSEADQLYRDMPMELSKREEEKLLDEELQRLPHKYRLPLLLCYFEGLTQEEAATQLGWTPGKLEGMLNRGRERLRFRLIRRGVTSTTASAGLLALSSLSAGVPNWLAASTAKAAVNAASGQGLSGCGVSAAVAALAKQGLVMDPKKNLLILAMLFLAGTLTFCAAMRMEADRPSVPPVFAHRVGFQEKGELQLARPLNRRAEEETMHWKRDNCPLSSLGSSLSRWFHSCMFSKNRG
jgi:hypothetical protein